MIGYHLARKLQSQGHHVWGLDDFNDYYDPRLKLSRARILRKLGVEVLDEDLLHTDWFYHLDHEKPDVVVHLAAYTNPRHSLDHVQLYINVNITGTQHLIDACKKYGINNVIYASSSCVMEGQPLPYRESDRPALQTNPYAWTKRANESQFSHAGIARVAGLRFFTVYGPYGRPDMALGLFVDGIVQNRPITIYNHGNMKRDWTYVEDICQGVELVANRMMAEPDAVWNEIYNIGSGVSTPLLEFVAEIERCLGREAIRDLQPRHPGDVEVTLADISQIQALGYHPRTPISVGVQNFVSWYLDYYRIQL